MPQTAVGGPARRAEQGTGRRPGGTAHSHSRARACPREDPASRTAAPAVKLRRWGFQKLSPPPSLACRCFKMFCKKHVSPLLQQEKNKGFLKQTPRPKAREVPAQQHLREPCSRPPWQGQRAPPRRVPVGPPPRPGSHRPPASPTGSCGDSEVPGSHSGDSVSGTSSRGLGLLAVPTDLSHCPLSFPPRPACPSCASLGPTLLLGRLHRAAL